MTQPGFPATLQIKGNGYRIVGIYYESFNFVIFVMVNALVKIKASNPYIFCVSPVVQ